MALNVRLEVLKITENGLKWAKSPVSHHEKTCFMPYENNRDADQPAHLLSQVGIFVVCGLDSMIHVLILLI